MFEKAWAEVITEVGQHVWQQIMIIDDVEVLPDPDHDGAVIIVNKNSQLEAAKEDARVGCMICGKSLDEAYGTECTGLEEGSIPHGG
jgi:hypothetical protein